MGDSLDAMQAKWDAENASAAKGLLAKQAGEVRAARQALADAQKQLRSAVKAKQRADRQLSDYATSAVGLQSVEYREGIKARLAIIDRCGIAILEGRNNVKRAERIVEEAQAALLLLARKQFGGNNG